MSKTPQRRDHFSWIAGKVYRDVIHTPFASNVMMIWGVCERIFFKVQGNTEYTFPTIQEKWSLRCSVLLMKTKFYEGFFDCKILIFLAKNFKHEIF